MDVGMRIWADDIISNLAKERELGIKIMRKWLPQLRQPFSPELEDVVWGHIPEAHWVNIDSMSGS